MKQSRYKALRRRNISLRHRGFDYKGRMLMKATDPALYKNDNIRGFALKLESMLNEWFSQAKRIKTFFNFAVPKDSDDIN